MAKAGVGTGMPPEGARQDNVFSLTFSIETLRMLANLSLVGMVAVGIFVTRYFVTVPSDETAVYAIFGFNHICNVFDHQPSRTVSALLVLFFILPMASFVVLSFLRTADAAKEGTVPRYLHTYSSAITPFCFFAICYTYMWFVSAPDGEYGFIAHYLPYVALQLALGLLAVQEVGFLYHAGQLPFGVSIRVARAYVAFLLVTTAVCQTAVFSLLLGYPILDSVNSHGAAVAFQVLMYLYSFLAIVVPIITASRNRKNGHVNTISFG